MTALREGRSRADPSGEDRRPRLLRVSEKDGRNASSSPSPPTPPSLLSPPRQSAALLGKEWPGRRPAPLLSLGLCP